MKKVEEFRTKVKNSQVWIGEKLPAAENDNYGSSLRHSSEMQNVNFDLTFDLNLTWISAESRTQISEVEAFQTSLGRLETEVKCECPIGNCKSQLFKCENCDFFIVCVKRRNLTSFLFSIWIHHKWAERRSGRSQT